MGKAILNREYGFINEQKNIDIIALVYYYTSALERMMKMKFNTATPIYQQVVADLKKKIVNGTIHPGDKLPSGRDLAVEYKINPNTSSRVYALLEEQGITYTKRGIGTFVIDDENIVDILKEEMANHLLTFFMNNMHELGYSSDDIIDLIRRNEKC